MATPSTRNAWIAVGGAAMVALAAWAGLTVANDSREYVGDASTTVVGATTDPVDVLASPEPVPATVEPASTTSAAPPDVAATTSPPAPPTDSAPPTSPPATGVPAPVPSLPPPELDLFDDAGARSLPAPGAQPPPMSDTSGNEDTTEADAYAAAEQDAEEAAQRDAEAAEDWGDDGGGFGGPPVGEWIPSSTRGED